MTSRRYLDRVSTSDWRARDQDRDAAIETVEAAWADGQIVEADRDHRVGALLRAQTLAEVRMLVHDLQLPETTRHVAPPPAAPNPYATPPEYATRQPVTGAGAGPRRAGCLVGLMVAIALAGVAVAGLVAVIDMSSSVEFPGDDSSALPLPGVAVVDDVNVLSREGYRDLVRAVSKASGSTEAFEAVVYPRYAVLTLPVDSRSQREDRWYWDGELDSLDSKGTSSYERFDLASVDADVMVRLVKRVRRTVDRPTSWYVIVRAPDVDDGASIWAYASNEYSESAYLAAKPDGTVVYDSTKQ